MHHDPIAAVNATADAAGYEMRFMSLFQAGRALSFPCDAQGHVLLEALSERARAGYQRARALVGIDYSLPVVWHDRPNGCS